MRTEKSAQIRDLEIELRRLESQHALQFPKAVVNIQTEIRPLHKPILCYGDISFHIFT